jgi:hypothetical protein
MEASELSAKATLKETQDFNRRSSFENRFALLLAQHDHYHHQVCDYIDMGRNNVVNKDDDAFNYKVRKEVVEFFKTDYFAESLQPCLDFLTGHEIISRYMRTLYHLLKFVHNEFYFKGGELECLERMKGYTSPIRSSIRNDVLCMIAVNALNVDKDNAKTLVILATRGCYICLIFLNTLYFSPFEPNIFGDDDFEKKVQDLIVDKKSKYIHNIVNVNNKVKIFKEPDLRFFSPVIICLLTYDNPMKTTTEIALSNLYGRVSNTFGRQVSEFINLYTESVTIINDIRKWNYQESTDGDILNVTPEIIAQFRMDSEGKRRKPFKDYRFIAPEYLNLSDKYLDGESLHYHFEMVLRYESLCKEYQECGDIDRFIESRTQGYKAHLKDFYSQIKIYCTL